MRSLFLTCAALATFLSPALLRADVYELRTYTTNEGKLEALQSRFRDHTVKLFEKHGMKNVGYWVPTDKRSDNTLIYIIQHKSRDAANASWKAFMGDPDWQAAYKASVADGRLVKKVESVYMNGTDYNPKFESGKGDDDSVFELRIYTTNE